MDKEMGDVGTELVIENENFKAWDLVLEPGESSDWHQHTMNYLFVVTEPGTLKAEYDDGSSQVVTYRRGQIVIGQKNSIHRVTNVGDSRWSNAVVERKP